MDITYYRELHKKLREYNYFQLAEYVEYRPDKIGIISLRTPAEVVIPNFDFNYWFDLKTLKVLGEYRLKIDYYEFRRTIVNQTVRGHHGMIIFEKEYLKDIPVKLDKTPNINPFIGLCMKTDWQNIYEILEEFRADPVID